ncbi:hypothetical protein ACTFIW_011057 [Dictyostelium discoideum]
MLMKAPCFVCSQEQSFSPKTILKFTDHVYNCINNKLDENGIDKIDFGQLKEKNEKIEQLEQENYSLKKTLNKLREELESQSQPQLMKKLKLNMSDDYDDFCSTPTKNVIQPPNQTIQPENQTQIQPTNQTQPQTPTGEISTQTPTKPQSIVPNNSDYDISVCPMPIFSH